VSPSIIATDASSSQISTHGRWSSMIDVETSSWRSGRVNQKRVPPSGSGLSKSILPS
jgi:hypothetical protein